MENTYSFNGMHIKFKRLVAIVHNVPPGINGLANSKLIAAIHNTAPALIAELEEARKAAARYRWLRDSENDWCARWPHDHITDPGDEWIATYGQYLDAAIDAARKEMGR